MTKKESNDQSSEVMNSGLQTITSPIKFQMFEHVYDTEIKISSS